MRLLITGCQRKYKFCITGLLMDDSVFIHFYLHCTYRCIKITKIKRTDCIRVLLFGVSIVGLGLGYKNTVFELNQNESLAMESCFTVTYVLQVKIN